MSDTVSAARSVAIFISSPADVEPERDAARRVIALLDGRWAEHVHLTAYDYREESFNSLDGFQEQVPDVTRYDLVLGILWKRIGTRLNPAKFSAEDPSHASGTVYELESAFAAAERSGGPDVVVFRKSAAVQYDEGAVEKQHEQRRQLLAWWAERFGAPGEPVKRAWISFQTTDEFDDALEKWLESWLRKRALIPTGPAWSIARDGSPYPGLLAYDARHSRVFKGRDASIKQALALLRRRAQRGAWSLFVLGPSGSGKSSFARAGLAPRVLSAGGMPGCGAWRQVILEPSDDPLALFARRLFAGADSVPPALPELAAGPYAEASAWARLAAASPESAAASVAWALDHISREAGQESHAGPARLLLIADQLEALAANAAFDLLVAVFGELAHAGRTLFLATLRSDSYAVLQSQPAFRAMRGDDGVFDLLPPGRQELREIIEAPAADAGLAWDIGEDGQALNDVLAREVASADALPLLQMTLAELFERRDAARNLLTFAGYREIGGFNGAIAARADQTLTTVSVEAQKDLDPLLRELVADADAFGGLTLRTPPRQWYQATPARAELVRAFVGARLLVEDVDHVRIAHEALLRHWPRARQSPALQPEALRIGRVLAPLAAAWSASRSDDDLVVAPTMLAAATELIKAHPGALDATVECFVDAAERALAAQRELALRQARSRELAAYVRVELDVDQSQALKLAIDAHDQADTPEALAALREGLHAARCRAVINASAAVSAIAVAPDRPLFATAHVDGAVHLWDAVTLTWWGMIPGRGERAGRLTFDPRGKYLAVSRFGRVTIYDAASWSEVSAFDCFNGVVSVDFSRDGKRVVVAHGASAEVHDTLTGERLRSWNGAVIVNAYFSGDGARVVGNFDDSYHVAIWNIEENTAEFDESTGGRVWSSVLDPEGKWLITAGRSGVRLFLLAGPKPRRGIIVGNEGDEAAEVVLIDRKEAAVAGENGIITIWALPDHWSDDPAWQPRLKQLAVLQGHRGPALHLAWHSAAGLLASAGEDGTVRLWRRTSRIVWDAAWQPSAVLRRHTARIVRVAFTPDGSRLVSQSMDGEARVWNTKITGEGPVFCAYQRSFLDSRISNGLDVVAFSRDARRLLTLTRGKVARVWDTGSGHELARLGTVAANDAWGFSTTETPATCCAVFSGDASLVATGHEDGSAAIWNAESGKKLRSIKGHGAAINYIQFDGAGRHVITAGEDGTVRFWHARTGRCALTLGPVDSAAVSVLLNRDESLLAVSHKDKAVTLWQRGSCRLIARLGDAHQPALDPVFDEAEPALRTAGANDGSMRVWDLNSGALKLQESFKVARSSVYSGWTLQGSFFIAADGEGEMRLWRRGGPEEPLVLRGHSKKILAVAPAPDGAVLLSGSEDESARLWDLSSGRQIAIFPAHGAAVTAVTFSPDGKLIATATREGSVHIWYARAADLKQEARSRLPLILRPGHPTEAALSISAADPPGN